MKKYYLGHTRLWIKDLSVARHQAWRSAGKVVMLRFREIILDHIVIEIGQRILCMHPTGR